MPPSEDQFVCARVALRPVWLLLGRALLLTSFARPTGGRHVLVLKDSISLDARRRLHLVEHGNRGVLLLTGGEIDLVVGWVDPP